MKIGFHVNSNRFFLQFKVVFFLRIPTSNRKSFSRSAVVKLERSPTFQPVIGRQAKAHQSGSVHLMQRKDVNKSKRDNETGNNGRNLIKLS